MVQFASSLTRFEPRADTDTVAFTAVVWQLQRKGFHSPWFGIHCNEGEWGVSQHKAWSAPSPGPPCPLLLILSWAGPPRRAPNSPRFVLNPCFLLHVAGSEVPGHRRAPDLDSHGQVLTQPIGLQPCLPSSPPGPSYAWGSHGCFGGPGAHEIWFVSFLSF